MTRARSHKAPQGDRTRPRSRPRSRSSNSSAMPRDWSACRAARATGRSRPGSSAATRAARSRPRAACFAPSVRDRFRVELQRPFWRHDRARNRALAGLAERLGVACVATGNVHSHHPDRARLQDALVAVRLRSTLDQTEPERRGNSSSVMASPRRDGRALSRPPRRRRRDGALAERLEFDLTRDLGYRYPGSEDPLADRKLAELCRARLDERYRGTAERAEAEPRLEEELRVIRTLGLSGFFLLHHDMLELAREVAREVRGTSSVRALLPPGRGRGSSVSSIVCYLTGLSHIDPIRNKLFLGRFLNEEITALPDIDLDFPRDIREKLIPRVHERYGTERAALVGVVRDLPLARRDPRPRQGARPAGGRDRARRALGRRLRRPDDFARGVEEVIGARRAALAALAGADRALPGGVRAAAPRLPAPGRDGDRDRAADRPLPRAAVGDGGAQPRPVGQGLLRRRRLPQDRPAGVGDAVGGRALRRRDRARARRADRPLARPVRRPGGLRGDPARRHDRRVPDREPRADAEHPPHQAREPRRPDRAGRARAAGADPGRRGAPLYREARAAPRRIPTSRFPTSTRRSSRCWRRRSA